MVLAELKRDSDPSCAIVPRYGRHRGARRSPNGPFALAAIAGEVGIGQESLQAGLARASFELRAFDPPLSRDERRAGGQLDLVDDAARDLALERTFAHVA